MRGGAAPRHGIPTGDARIGLSPSGRQRSLFGHRSVPTALKQCGFATLLDPHGGRPALAGLGALNGQLSSLDLAARRFVLRGTTVSYGGAEVLFSNGSAAKLSGYTGSLKV